MTMPPLHHGPDDDGRLPSRGDGPGPGLRRAYTFLGVMVTCALICYFGLRLVGIGRGDLSLGWALAMLGISAVAAAVITRALDRRPRP